MHCTDGYLHECLTTVRKRAVHTLPLEPSLSLSTEVIEYTCKLAR